MRAVLELAGIRDILAKSLGTTNPINMAKATVAALQGLRRPDEVARARGKAVQDILPLAKRTARETAQEAEAAAAERAATESNDDEAADNASS